MFVSYSLVFTLIVLGVCLSACLSLFILRFGWFVIIDCWFVPWCLRYLPICFGCWLDCLFGCLCETCVFLSCYLVWCVVVWMVKICAFVFGWLLICLGGLLHWFGKFGLFVVVCLVGLWVVSKVFLRWFVIVLFVFCIFIGIWLRLLWVWIVVRCSLCLWCFICIWFVPWFWTLLGWLAARWCWMFDLFVTLCLFVFWFDGSFL